MPTITLLTDFGLTDTYVGSLKGSIASINPRANVVDLCHTISPQNILEGAYVLRSVYRDYPRGTIFVCVVDPGVGSGRKAILLQTRDYFFIGPDNGIFSSIYRLEKKIGLFVLDKPRYYRHPVSHTFHGRDVFAPTAAWLSRLRNPRKIGTPMKRTPVTLALPEPKPVRGGLKGQIMRIDRFGNLMTNIHQDNLKTPSPFPGSAGSPRRLSSRERVGERVISIGGRVIPFGRFYAEGTRRKARLVGVFSSSGFLEIAADCGSAEKILRRKAGTPVFLFFR